MKSEKDYRQLCEEVWQHNYRYFVANAPSITDQEYDALFSQLIEFEKQHPEWIYPGSPTQRIGETPSTTATAPHSKPMLSLANTYSPEQVQEFLARMQKLLGDQAITYETELKIDGVALSVRYEKGLLVRAVTRGDGERGDAITAQARTIASLPLQLCPPFPDVVEARGEVFMTKADFARLNRQAVELGKPLFANPRNAAAGSLKLLDVEAVSKRPLSISFYTIAELSSFLSPLTTQYEALQQLKKWGLPVLAQETLCHSFEEIMAFASRVEKQRSSLPYEIDGIVIKLNSLSLQNTLGATGKNYRWAVAYKFAATRAETLVRMITVQVGRSGILTPVAELEPVLVAGSTITRATLHNADEIQRLDVRVNDHVLIEKGGDVIPKIVQVNRAKRSKESQPWQMPLVCPACGSRVEKESGEVGWRCLNRLVCPEQALRRLLHFTGKSGMDMDHVGERLIQQLVEKGFITRPSDIYLVTAEQLSQIPHFKEKAIHNVLTSIQRSKETSLERLICALGIRHVGSETATILADEVGSLEKLAEMSEEQLLTIHGVGPKLAEALVTFFADPDHQEEIRRLLEYGVVPHLTHRTPLKTHLFSGKTFVLTGTLHHYTRQGATLLIKERGGRVASSISRTTDYLLIGASPGSKETKARALGIALLSEEEFRTLL